MKFIFFCSERLFRVPMEKLKKKLFKVQLTKKLAYRDPTAPKGSNRTPFSWYKSTDSLYSNYSSFLHYYFFHSFSRLLVIVIWQIIYFETIIYALILLNFCRSVFASYFPSYFATHTHKDRTVGSGISHFRPICLGGMIIQYISKL